MSQRSEWACAMCHAPADKEHHPGCYHSPEGIERERAEERAAGRSGNLYRMAEVVTAVEAFEQGYRRGVVDGATTAIVMEEGGTVHSSQ